MAPLTVLRLRLTEGNHHHCGMGHGHPPRNSRTTKHWLTTPIGQRPARP